MRLNKLHRDDQRVFTEYIHKLRRALNGPSVLSEQKITITIDTDEGKPQQVVSPISAPQPQIVNPTIKVSEQAKTEFAKKIVELGNFEDPMWVEQLVNGMKQVGVQGLNPIQNRDRPVTRGEMKKLIEILVGLVGK